MKILIDVVHYPHINFYKNAIRILKDYGIEVDMVVQPRGNLTSIVEKEFSISYKSFGHHQSSLFKKALGLLLRDIQMVNYLKNSHCAVATGVCGINIAHAAFLLRKPSVVFDDDIEQRLVYYPYKYFAKYIVMPTHVPATGHNILKYKGFKELAYLHPNHFNPNEAYLKEYGLKPNNYVFIREVERSTTNYYGLKEGELAGICPDLKNMGFDIVLSLENKSLKNQFEKHCIILQEPVSDVHSLMYYAAFTIASGDSMSRESCLLGTPAIYTGGRKMSINFELEKKGCFIPCKSDKEQILNTVNKILKGDLKGRTRQIIGEAIELEWTDTTKVIIDCLMAAMYKDESLIQKYKVSNMR